MKLAILLVVGVIAKQAYGDEPEPIVGGNVASPGQFKHQVSLKVADQHICGGSIIDETHILTAAYCVDNYFIVRFMKVVVGTTNWAEGTTYEMKWIDLHPNYTGKISDGWNDNIAVITLETPIEENEFQGRIPLASKDYATGKFRGIISGWGMIRANSSEASPILRWVEINILSKKQCLNNQKKLGLNNPYTTEKQICTLEKVGKGACQGDNGGPLMVNGELCGIVSMDLSCGRGYDVFTNVFYYLDFIKESIEK